jgi:RNA polymerase sigma factor (sigma-70 family)
MNAAPNTYEAMEHMSAERIVAEQDRRIAETVEREQGRLRNFIRRRVPDGGEAEDILQDVFSELVEAYRLMQPIEQVGAWLFRVARNRITDWFRKRKPEALRDQPVVEDEGEALTLEDLLPSREAGPELAFTRSMLVEELEDAIEELPAEQREVFLAHEIEGRSFKQLAAETGLSVNTLLSRKHYAVLYLRERLRDIYEELNRRQD